MKNFALVLILLIFVGCSSSRNAAIVIGSKNFTEQVLLGEIAAQQLERKLHVAVDRKLGLGGTLLTHEAIVGAGIDLYPEYTGTAASAILKQQPANDPQQVYSAVRDAYLEKFHLAVLPPLGFNDTFAMVIRTTDAKKLSQPTLSAGRQRSWRLGIGFEFLTRQDGLSHLDTIYGIHWNGLPTSMDLGLLYLALDNKQIDMAAASSTDARLSEPQYTALKDDQGAFPPYNACFIVRQELLRERPAVRQALGLLEGRISDDAMRAMNRRVDIGHEQVAKVARDFLAKEP